MIWMTILLSLLGMLINWLANKKASGGLTLAEKARLGVILTKMKYASNEAMDLGCVPTIEAESMEAITDSRIQDRLYEIIVRQVVIPKLASKLPPDLQPAIEQHKEEWANYLISVFKD